MQTYFVFPFLYFLLSLLLLGMQIVITTKVQDSIIRPYGGDFRIVILLYYVFRSFLQFAVLRTAVFVLNLAYLIEISQFFHPADQLGIIQHSLARIQRGSYLFWVNMVSYLLGNLLVFLLEKVINKRFASILH